MPNIKSAKKRVKVTATKRARNKTFNSSLKTAIKNANIKINNNSEDKSNAFCTAVKSIDKAVNKGIIHKNTAARKKSALAKKFNSKTA